MKFNGGNITEELSEIRAFYSKAFGFGVTFETDFYFLLQAPNHKAEISFLLSNHPSQPPLFQESFQNGGVYLTIEIDEVNSIYQELKGKGFEMLIDIRDEPWCDGHFAIKDPNGMGIDIVKYSPTN